MKRKKQEVDDRPSAPEEKISLWAAISGLVPFIATVVVIILNIGQISKVAPEKEKIIAETRKINTEELKTRVELQTLLNDLAIEKTKGPDAYEQKLTQVLPELQATIEKLNTFNNAQTGDLAVENLYKSMLIGIFLTAVFFFLNTFSITWNWLISVVRNLFYALRPWWNSKYGQGGRYESIQKYINIIEPLIAEGEGSQAVWMI